MEIVFRDSFSLIKILITKKNQVHEITLQDEEQKEKEGKGREIVKSKPRKNLISGLMNDFVLCLYPVIFFGVLYFPTGTSKIKYLSLFVFNETSTRNMRKEWKKGTRGIGREAKRNI